MTHERSREIARLVSKWSCRDSVADICFAILKEWTAPKPASPPADAPACDCGHAKSDHADGSGFCCAIGGECKCDRYEASEAPPAAKDRAPFQSRVGDWMAACFPPEVARDARERNHRYLEESLELVQSLGCSKEDVMKLVDYVFSRPLGDPQQEVGGVMVTLAALCTAADVQLDGAAEGELARVWTLKDKIRAKHDAKPRWSPLPGNASAPPAANPLPDAGTVGEGTTETTDKTVFAWVIERDTSKPGRPEYWTGRRHPAARWSDPGDHAAAIRFSRKEDALRVAACFDPDREHRVCEHGWSEHAALIAIVASAIDRHRAAAFREGMERAATIADHTNYYGWYAAKAIREAARAGEIAAPPTRDETHPQEVITSLRFALADAIDARDEALADNARLRDKLRVESYAGDIDVAKLQGEVARLRTALQDLYDVQNGPPLPKYEQAWERAMEGARAVLSGKATKA